MLIFKKDLINRFKFGNAAPKFGEAIYVNPQTCSHLLIPGQWNRDHSGHVAAGDWDLKILPVTESPKYKYCYDHWVNGTSWKDAGAYDYLKRLIDQRGVPVEGCVTDADIIRRFEKLDKIFEQVSKAGELYPQKKLNPENFRATGGVYFHIDRNNVPLFSGGGAHRFAMSKILNFSIIPGQLGVVHKAALNNWMKYKDRPE